MQFASTVPTTASADIISASTFGPVNPEPVPETKPRVTSEKTGDLTGFLPEQDRVTITQEAREKAQANQVQDTNSQNNTSSTQESNQEEAPSDEFIQVSSSIGRAAQTGNLSRGEAMAIYQKIASLI